MTVGGQLFLEACELVCGQEAVGILKQIAGDSKCACLRELQIVNIVAGCIGVSVNAQLCQIVLLLWIHEYLTVDREDLAEHGNTLFGQLALIVGEEYVRVEGDCAAGLIDDDV